MKKLYLLLLSVFALAACSEKIEEQNITSATTGEATHISCRNAVLSGKASLPSSTASDLKIGILYSTGSGVLYGSATAIEAKSFDASYNFTVTASVLEPETTYYYRTYVFQNSEVSYGETKSFTTSAIGSLIQTLDATDIDASIATLHASLNLTDCEYKELDYGFKVKPEGGGEKTIYADNLSNNAFSTKVVDLVRSKPYEVCAFVTLDGKSYTGEQKSFNTNDITASISVNPVTDITEYRATISGKIEVSSVGQFRKSATLLFSDTFSNAEDILQHGSNRSLILQEDGAFSETISVLKPNTTYFFMIVAGVEDVELRSDVLTFSTSDYNASFPSIGVEATEHNATLKATVTVDSKEQIGVVVWFLYSSTATDAASLRTSGIRIDASQTTTEWLAYATNLTVDTEYHMAAVALVGDKEIMSDVQSFRTGAVNIQAVLRNNAQATENSLVLNGIVINNMQEKLIGFQSAFKVCYSAIETTPEAISNSGSSIDVYLNESGEFTTTLENLSSNTKYNCMVVSILDGITVLGEVSQFSTTQIDASVTTSEAESIGYSTVTLHGNVSVNSTQPLSKRAYFLYSESASTLETLKAHNSITEAELSDNGTFKMSFTNLKNGTTYFFASCVEVYDTMFYGEVRSFTLKNLPEGGVDLGLSVCWSENNLGANYSYEYGDYFAWGETSTKATYNWANYKWCVIEGNYKLTKYNTKTSNGTVDNKTILEIEDDVAHKYLGDDWHIPSVEDWEELRTMCKWTWKTRGGVNGYLVTSNITQKSIFIPVAGYKTENTSDYVGYRGFYFLSSISTDYPDAAYTMSFSYDRVEKEYIMNRFIGKPLRTVSY